MATVDKVLDIAIGEVGYLERKNNKDLRTIVREYQAGIYA